MSYSVVYQDENGVSREYSITEEDSQIALENDYEELMRLYRPRYVTIQRVQAASGEALHLKITVNAPSHYLKDSLDTDPNPCDSMTVDIICYPGYPLESVKAFYAKDRRLASPNVFTSGDACIDKWIPFTSSLRTVADKLIHDMIHDPNVSRYDSPACADMISWHKDGVKEGLLPTISPKLLEVPQADTIPPLPSQRPNRPIPTPPPMPPRTH